MNVVVSRSILYGLRISGAVARLNVIFGHVSARSVVHQRLSRGKFAELGLGRRRIKSEARSVKKKKKKMGQSDKKIRHRGEIGLWAEMMRSIEDQGFYFWRRDLEILLLVLAGL